MNKKAVKMSLSVLKKPERNVRMHTEAQLAEFERSVAMFGQIRPIVIDEQNIILAGNGLYETLIRLGWKEADVYQMTGLTEREKKKLMLADNKIYSLGIDDLNTFDAFLVELDGDFDIPGFDESILRSMVAMPEDITDVISGYGVITDEEKDELAAAADRKAEAMQDTPAEGKGEPFANAQEARRETRQSVTCPKCGELIWL